MQVGMVQPKVVLIGFEQTIQSYFDVEPSNNSFFQPFTRMAAFQGDEATQKALQQQAKTLIADSVQPALPRIL